MKYTRRDLVEMILDENSKIYDQLDGDAEMVKEIKNLEAGRDYDGSENWKFNYNENPDAAENIRIAQEDLAVEIAQEFENLGLMAEDENGEWELKF
jgi:hypothetical protein